MQLHLSTQNKNMALKYMFYIYIYICIHQLQPSYMSVCQSWMEKITVGPVRPLPRQSHK